MNNPVDFVNHSLATRMALFDDNKMTWNHLVDWLLSRGGSMIALRGAGSVNGMDKSEIDALINERLIPDIERLLCGGNVAILYDGDDDDLAKPDIGYVAGRLLDRFGNNGSGVIFIAVQISNWYSPRHPGGNIANAYDQDYVTYVIERDVYPGDHSEFTQDHRLVSSENYEQWYIGASGEIAKSQLIDFNKKVPVGQKRRATIFRVKNNPNLDALISERLEAARAEDNTVRIEKFRNQLKYRQFVYGAHWNNDGTPLISVDEFPQLDITFVVL